MKIWGTYLTGGMKLSKPFKDLTIKDAFMFAAVMSDPCSCRRLLEIVLEMPVLEVTVDTEKSMVYHPEYHGIRLDVLAEEKGRKRRFNIKMQVKSEVDLPCRSRYYHSQLDMDALLSGKRYRELPDTYVIFICDFSVEDSSLYRYTYRSVCLEDGRLLGDGRTTIFLSTCGRNESQVSKALVSFLRYVKDPEKKSPDRENDRFIEELERQIKTIKRDRGMEERYMMLEEMLRDEREAGLEEGHKTGLQRGSDIMAQLAGELMAQKRYEDLERCTQDRVFREKLFEEFGLTDQKQ